MSITKEQLIAIMPKTAAQADRLVLALNTAATRYKINSKSRMAAWLAQLAHESGQLQFKVEGLNYKVDALVPTFGLHRITQAQAKQFGRIDNIQAADQKAIANIVYGGEWGRKNLGNVGPNDGWNYRGRGGIQLTGLGNYKAAGSALGLDLVNNPEQLEVPENSIMAAAWYWANNGLNELADGGQAKFQDIGSIINTGKKGRVPKGASERLAYYNKAIQVLSA
jgi:putative chitinase